VTGDDLSALRSLLRKHEGEKLRAYVDTKGKITIGVGRNLTDKGLTASESTLLLDNDITECVNDLVHAFPWFLSLDGVRQQALVDYRFNLGMGKLLRAAPRMLACLNARDYDGAARELLDGPWKDDVGPIRAGDLETMLRTARAR
jgi:lysozyme